MNGNFLNTIPCMCGTFRALPPDLKYFKRFVLGPCMRCGAPFNGIRIPLLGVMRVK